MIQIPGFEIEVTEIVVPLVNERGEHTGYIRVKPDGTFRGEYFKATEDIFKISKACLMQSSRAKGILMYVIPADKPSECPFTQSHTREFCGYETCRES